MRYKIFIIIESITLYGSHNRKSTPITEIIRNKIRMGLNTTQLTNYKAGWTTNRIWKNIDSTSSKTSNLRTYRHVQRMMTDDKKIPGQTQSGKKIGRPSTKKKIHAQ